MAGPLASCRGIGVIDETDDDAPLALGRVHIARDRRHVAQRSRLQMRGAGI
jgi:hypothetical protein